MIASLYPWLKPELANGLKALSGGHHAWLIVDRHHAGGEALAQALAASLLCARARGQSLACGACEPCRWLAQGAHPDCRVLEPDAPDEDKPGARREIKVEHVRAVVDMLALTAATDAGKVVVLPNAESLNTNAANALLKMLEEPPAGTRWLLACKEPRALPATILSRCLRFELGAVPQSVAIEWLTEQGVAKPAALLAQGGGAPVVALALSAPEVQRERSAFLSALCDPTKLSVLAMGDQIEAVPKAERKDALARSLTWLSRWVYDWVRVRSGIAATFNPDYENDLKRLGSGRAALAMIRYHDEVLRALALAEHPLQPRLVIESLLLNYRKLMV